MIWLNDLFVYMYRFAAPLDPPALTIYELTSIFEPAIFCLFQHIVLAAVIFFFAPPPTLPPVPLPSFLLS